jgi:hypothetical protein
MLNELRFGEEAKVALVVGRRARARRARHQERLLERNRAVDVVLLTRVLHVAAEHAGLLVLARHVRRPQTVVGGRLAGSGEVGLAPARKRVLERQRHQHAVPRAVVLARRSAAVQQQARGRRVEVVADDARDDILHLELGGRERARLERLGVVERHTVLVGLSVRGVGDDHQRAVAGDFVRLLARTEHRPRVAAVVRHEQQRALERAIQLEALAKVADSEPHAVRARRRVDATDAVVFGADTKRLQEAVGGGDVVQRRSRRCSPPAAATTSRTTA